MHLSMNSQMILHCWNQVAELWIVTAPTLKADCCTHSVLLFSCSNESLMLDCLEIYRSLFVHGLPEWTIYSVFLQIICFGLHHWTLILIESLWYVIFMSSCVYFYMIILHMVNAPQCRPHEPTIGVQPW